MVTFQIYHRELGIDVENNFQPKYQVSKEKKEIVKKLKTNLRS